MKHVSEICKYCVKSVLFIGKFLDAAVEFVNCLVIATVEALEFASSAAQECNRDHCVAGQNHQGEEQYYQKHDRIIHGRLPFSSAGSSCQSLMIASQSGLKTAAP